MLSQEQLNNQLLDAAKRGDLGCIKQAIQDGADVNTQDKYGNTALHLAVWNSHSSVIEQLVGSPGFNLNIRNNLHCTALNLPIKIHQYDKLDTFEALTKALLNNNIDVTGSAYGVLNWAIHLGYSNVVKGLLKLPGIDVNEVDISFSDGYSPLHLAARNGNISVVKELLKVPGVDVNKQQVMYRSDRPVSYGYTPLELSLFTKSTMITKLLISHEIKLKSPNAEKPRCLLEGPDDVFTREMSEYWDKYLEVEKMKKEKIDESTTLYSILTCKDNELVSYERKGILSKVLDYKSKFPMHANDLERQFKMGKQRLDALSTGETISMHFPNFKEEVGVFNWKIAEYLSNEDIKNLRKAAIQTMDMDEEVPQSLDNVNVENLNRAIRGAQI